VLGCLFLESGDALSRVAARLEPDDFYPEAHRIVFRAMLAMGVAGEPIDLITLTEHLRRTEELHQVGGAAALALLTEHAAVAPHLDRYVGIVREMAALRELIQTSTGLVVDAFDATENVQTLLDRARTSLERLGRRAASASTAFSALRLGELLQLPVPDVTFHVDGWIPRNGVTFVVGDSEAFKSWFTAYLAFSVASGRPLFGRIPVRQAPTLFISEENGQIEDKRRAAKLARGLGLADAPCYIASEQFFRFDDPARYAALRAFVRQHGIELIIVDSFVRVHRLEERDSGAMSALYMDRMKPLIRDGADLVLLHHKRKLPAGVKPVPGSDGDDIRGSTDLRAASHAVLFLRALSDTKVLVKHNKTRGFKRQEPFVFSVTDDDQGGITLTWEGKPEEALDKTGACREAILLYAQAHPVFVRADVLKEFKGRFSKKILDPILEALSAKGYPLKLERARVGRSTKTVYQYVSDGPEAGADDERDDVPF
jgi:hypothetical protein